MSHGYNSCVHVNQDNGHAVGCIHADDNPRKFGYQCVNTLKDTLLTVNIKRTEALIDDRHAAGMRLPRHDEVIEVNPQLHCQCDARVKHAQCIIAHIVTQVYTRIGIAPVYLTACGRECIHAHYRLRKIQLL